MEALVPRVASCSHGDVLLSGLGPFVEVYRNRQFCSKVDVFSYEGINTYGIVSSSFEGVFVYGERSIAFVSDDFLKKGGKVPQEMIRTFHDQILALRQFEDKVAVLFTCNMTCLFSVEIDKEGLKMRREESIQSDHTAVLLKALILGDNWADLYTIVGTVFGEILVSKPSVGPRVLHKYLGHTGMIFGLCLIEDRLFSISDDRSLRLWKWSPDLEKLSSGQEFCAYGHSARPFSIFSDSGTFIYTAGVDQTVCKWSFDSSNLRVVARYPLNIGCIRSLAWHDNSLFCGSENGGFVEFNPNIPDSSVEIMETCDGLRGFARLGTEIFTVDGRGLLYRNNEPIFPEKCLRFLVASPPSSNYACVAAYGDREVAVFHKCKTTAEPSFFSVSGRILSVVSASAFVFAYTADRRGFLLDLRTNVLTELCAAKAMDGIAKKKPFIPSAMAILQETDRAFLIVGSACGHILFAVVPFIAKEQNNKVFEMCTFIEVNRHLLDQVLCLSVCGKVVTSFTKNGYMQFWAVELEYPGPYMRFVSSKPVSDVVDLEMPCAVVTGRKNYIAGFHSTEFHLLDVHTGLSVYSVSCGGGNRPWQFHLNESGTKGTLEFIKKEKLIASSADLLEFKTLTQNLHKSQILFVHTLFTGEDYRLICSGSTDTQLVFTKVDALTGSWSCLRRIVEASGFQCLDSCSYEDDLLLATGCGKGRLVLWRLSIKGLISRDECCLTEIDTYRHKDESRIVDVKFLQDNPDHDPLFAAAHGDGSIGVYNLCNGKTRIICEVPAPDRSMFTKVKWLTLDGYIHLAAVSTAGLLWLWKVDGNGIHLVTKAQVALCGVSAFAVSQTASVSHFAVGLESGEVGIFAFRGDAVHPLHKTCYHCATVTHVEFAGKEGALKLLSTSLDCRFAVHSVDVDYVSFEMSKPLSIWDPSCFTVNRYSEVFVVGSGIQEFSLG